MLALENEKQYMSLFRELEVHVFGNSTFVQLIFLPPIETWGFWNSSTETLVIFRLPTLFFFFFFFESRSKDANIPL